MQPPTPPEWFGQWLADHKAAHPETDFQTFEEAHDGDPYRPWKTWVVRDQVTEVEAYATTDSLHRAPVNQRSNAGNHLNLLVKAVRALRDGRTEDEPPETLDRQRAQEASRGCPECGGQGLTARRFDVRVAEQDETVSLSFGCLCPLGRWFSNQTEGLFWLGDWPSLWPVDSETTEPITHGSWPELPPAGSRRIFGGWHTKSGIEVRVQRCQDSVLFANPVPVF